MKHKWMLIPGIALAFAALAQKNDSPEVMLGAGLHQEEVVGDCREAIKIYQRVTQQKSASRSVAARAQLRIGACHEKLGEREARSAYELVLSRYSDQPELVSEARSRIAALGGNVPNAVRVRRFSVPGGLLGWVPPDGRPIPYLGKDSALWLYDTISSQSRKIVEKPKGKSEGIGLVIISPDGRTVAYAHDDFDAGTEIRLVNADGTQNRQFYKSPEALNNNGYWPADWSPDGKQIAVRVGGNITENRQILMIPTSGGAGRLVYSSKKLGNKVRFSPDGQYLAFDEDQDIYVVRTDGGNATAVVDHPANDQLLGWTPDGDIVFASDRSGMMDIWSVPVRDGKSAGNPVLLYRDVSRGARFSGVTRDGTLFYSLRHEVAEIYTAQLDANGKLSPAAAMTGRYVGANSEPDYSPDGQFVAYVSGFPDSTPSAIRIRTLATNEERAITKPVPNVAQLRWYPGSQSLLVLAWPDNQVPRSVLYKVNVQTGAATSVNLKDIAPSAAANPTFSPDGKYLYYETGGSNSASPALSRLDLATGRTEEVFHPSTGYLRLYALSPDGSQIVFNWRKDTTDFLYVMQVGGTEPKLLYEYPKDEYARAWGALAWTRDGKSVFYHHGIGEQDELTRIPLATGKAEVLLTTGMIRRLNTHPDGRRIIWEARPPSLEDYAMENLFPKRASR